MSIRIATPSDAVGIAKVHVDSWRTTYRGIVSDDYLNNLSYEERNNRWESVLKTNPIVFVAENDSGEIIGFASGGKERSNYSGYDGELYAIYILQQNQKQGIGKKLVLSVADSLNQMGFKAMLIWVLEDNPARYFYEALGGKKIRKQPIEIGGKALQEIAYGWDDLNQLLNHH